MYREFPFHSSHTNFRKARNKYSELINSSKRGHWESWLENISSKNVWDLHKFTAAPASDGSKTRIPALKAKDRQGRPTEVHDNEGKSKLLHEVFFYPPPVNHGVEPNLQYQDPTISFEEISDEHIQRVDKTLNAYEAPGINGISNAVLTHCTDILATCLGPIYRATFNTNYYPSK